MAETNLSTMVSTLAFFGMQVAVNRGAQSRARSLSPHEPAGSIY
ncbi:hypothetical protein [Frankia sp. Cr1]|nr:hypothetical protein [Frankia sp. Cr1]